MLWKKVTKVAATAGAREGSPPLNAFDNALLAAGIGNINLIKVSSIVPPDVDIVDLPRIKPGALIPTAYAEATGDVPGQVVSAAVGYALPEDRTRPGVIMEYHDGASRAEAERTIRQMLEEDFRVRGEALRAGQGVAACTKSPPRGRSGGRAAGPPSGPGPMRPVSPRFIACTRSPDEAQIVFFGIPFEGTVNLRKGADGGPLDLPLASDSIETYSPALGRDLEDLAMADLGDWELPDAPPRAQLEAARGAIRSLWLR